jgi:pimeloyl-ACP methyl ester carboxylesterase
MRKSVLLITKGFKGKVFFLTIIVLFYSCNSLDRVSDPYENMNLITYGINMAYEFPNTKSKKLVIYIEGTGWYSVLGWKDGDNWSSLSSSKFFLDLFKDRFNVMIPERLNMRIGTYYLYNPDMRRNYTLENLVQSYAFTINNYLNERDYTSIVIIGHSEGASLLPLIYREIDKKEKITGMVAVSYGGLSVYEQVKILANTEIDMPDHYREACKNIDELKAEILLYPDSLGEIMGYTYRWWNSFLNYKPYDYYVNIDIPILFVHGKHDIIVPVESTFYIQENLTEKPFEYVYIENADHSFSHNSSKLELKRRVGGWVNQR